MRLLGIFSDFRIVKSGEAAGLSLAFPRKLDRTMVDGTYEFPMQQAIAANLLPGDVFYDIGANIGFFSLIAARLVGPTGHVYAFEPVESNAAAIVRSGRRNDFATIKVFVQAIGSRTGTADLLTARHIGGAVLASVGEPPDRVGCVRVEVLTMDEAIARHGLRPPSLLKIDVEGAELEVLHGMVETLSNYRPKLLYEIDDASMDGLVEKREAIAKVLTAARYRLAPVPASYPGVGWYVEHVLASPFPP
jgi:FkbM family methyltransferase